MPLGISFVPGQTPQQQQQGPAPQTAPALQQALQTISLRVPRFTNANAIAPPALLQPRQPGQPLPPVPGTPEWEEMMRRFRQPGPIWLSAPPSQPPSSPPPSTPPPHFVPIAPSEPIGPIGGPPPLPDKPLPDVRMPFSAMFSHLGTRMY